MQTDEPSELPLPLWHEIERICTEYEQAMRLGQPIEFGEFVNRVPPKAQAILRKELLALEAEYRHVALEEPGAPVVSAPELISTQTFVQNGEPDNETASFIVEAPRPLMQVSKNVLSQRPTALLLAMVSLMLLALGWYSLSGEKHSQTIVTDDPEVQVIVENGRITRVVDPISQTDYPLIKTDLDLDQAETPAGLRIERQNHRPFVLRRDGEEWIIIRGRVPVQAANLSPPVIEPPAARARPAPLPFQMALAYREAHDLDLNQLRTWLDGLPKELVPVDISTRVHCDPPRFNVLAVQTATPLTYRIGWSVPNDDVQKELDQNDGNVWRLLGVAPFVQGGNGYEHLIWVQDNLTWGSWGRYWNDVPALLDDHRKSHLRPIQISFNPPPAKTGISGFTFRPDEGLDWTCDFDLTGEQLAWKIERARQRGWRPDCLAAYDDGTGNGVLYSMVTVSNPSEATWAFRQDLTSRELEAALAKQQTLARRPKVVTSHTGSDREPRYTAIWVEYQPLALAEQTRRSETPAADVTPSRAGEELVGEVRRFEGFAARSWVTRCRFTPDGKSVIAYGGVLREWETATGKEVAAFGRSVPFGWGLDVSPDGQFAVTAGDNAELYIWNLKTHRGIAHWSSGLVGSHGFNACFSPSGNQILCWGGNSPNALLWDWQTQSLIQQFETTLGNGAACFSSDGQRILTAGVSHHVGLWDTKSGELIQVLQGHTDVVADVAIVPKGDRVVSASADQTLIVWDIKTGKPLRILKGHTAAVRCVAITRDGRRIISGADDRTARVWDLTSGEELAIFDANTDPEATSSVSDVQVSPDGKYGLTAAFDGSVRLWRLPAISTASAAPLTPEAKP